MLVVILTHGDDATIQSLSQLKKNTNLFKQVKAHYNNITARVRYDCSSNIKLHSRERKGVRNPVYLAFPELTVIFPLVVWVRAVKRNWLYLLLNNGRQHVCFATTKNENVM